MSDVFFVPTAIEPQTVLGLQSGARPPANPRTLIKVHGRCRRLALLLANGVGDTLRRAGVPQDARVVDPSVPLDVMRRIYDGSGAQVSDSDGWPGMPWRVRGHAGDVTRETRLCVSSVLDRFSPMVNVAHAKGHGFLGYSGAMNNLAMGLLDRDSRNAIHTLIGSPVLSADSCDRCAGTDLCVGNCPEAAITVVDGRLVLNRSLCTQCMHCVAVCPTRAWGIDRESTALFASTYARLLKRILRSKSRDRWLHVNCAVTVTRTCDCMSTPEPPLVDDIGVLVSHDIVALEQATIDLIGSQPLKPWVAQHYRVGPREHVLAALTGRDPYWLVDAAEHERLGRRSYSLVHVAPGDDLAGMLGVRAAA